MLDPRHIDDPSTPETRVLVLEPYWNLRELYRELFEQAGYTVWTVSGEDEADEAMELLRPDVVVLDPEGCASMRRLIRKARSGSRCRPSVVVNSGALRTKDSEEFDRVDAYVVKSSDVDALINAVGSLCEEVIGRGKKEAENGNAHRSGASGAGISDGP